MNHMKSITCNMYIHELTCTYYIHEPYERPSFFHHPIFQSTRAKKPAFFFRNGAEVHGHLWPSDRVAGDPHFAPAVGQSQTWWAHEPKMVVDFSVRTSD